MFANATVLSGSSVTVYGSNVGATLEAGEPPKAGNRGGASVWWFWTAPASGSVTISTAGSSFDTILGIFTGSSVSALTSIAYNDDIQPGVILQSRVTFNAVAGTRYAIGVDGYNGLTGNITLAVSQAAPVTTYSCAYTLSASSASFASSGGSGSVGVTSGTGCSWTASSGTSWITITAGASGTGSGTVSYSVAANTSTSSRTGTMTIAGQTFTVSQSGASCSYALSATSSSFSSSGGSGSVNVSSGTGCGWTASSGASWITITAGGSGSGSGTVSYSVAANTSSSSRSGTMTLAGQTFTVSQGGAGCTYAISPTSASFPSGGGTGSITVTATAGCVWVSTSGASWITINSSTGTGNGTVNFSVAANTSTSGRSGTITIAGNQTFTVSQAAAAGPTVSLTAPTSGATISGMVTLSASASDSSSSISKIDFYCDSTLVGTATAPASSITWNSAQAGDGSHGFWANAYDAAGNSSRSASVFVTTSNSTTGTPGQLQWVKTALTVWAEDVAETWSITTDKSGNTIIAGDYNDSINLGSGALPSSVVGIYDGFVAKYSPQGALLWSKTFGGAGNSSAKGVATDSQGNIIVVGSFSTTVNFGGVSLRALDPYNQGVGDMFVAKYSPAGSLLWVERFGGSLPDYATAVAVDGSDNIFFAGWFQSTDANFGGGIILSAGGNVNFAVAKLSSSGTTLWARNWGGSLAQAYGLAVDSSGNVVVTGRFSGSTDFGGGAISAVGQYSVFVAKYSGANGSYVWARGFGGASGANVGQSVAVDPTTGNVIVTGGFTGTANFGGGAVSSGSGEALFLAGYGSSGNFLWLDTYGGSGGTDQGNAVAIDGAGHLVLTGLKATPWNVGGTSWNMNTGCFIISYALSGSTAPVQRWTKLPAANTGSSVGNAVALDGFGHVLNGGSFSSGTVDFGGVSASSPSAATSAFVGQYSN
jgi:hypothetical protein